MQSSHYQMINLNKKFVDLDHEVFPIPYHGKCKFKGRFYQPGYTNKIGFSSKVMSGVFICLFHTIYISPKIVKNGSINGSSSNQDINIEEVKLQRRLYHKLIELSVKPSSNLRASSRKFIQFNSRPK